jgi:hypothetical protein
MKPSNVWTPAAALAMFVLWVTSRSKASSLLVLFVVADLAGVLGSR